MSSSADLEQKLVTQDPDVRLMLQVRDDVEGAFEVLLERYQHRVLGVMTHLIGGRPDEAEDLSQDVFLRVYRARKSYRPRAKFATWLFTIVNNVALNHLRGKGRDPTLRHRAASDTQTLTRPEERLPAPGGTASTQMRKAELAELVREALETLGEDQRLAVLLNKFEDMSYAEIATVMGRTEAAVKSLLARARSHLRDELEPYLRLDQVDV